MKKQVLLFVCTLAALLMSVGCNKVKELGVTSFEIVSITPSGTSELDATVRVGIHNPLVAFEATDVIGTLKLNGKPCLHLTADQLIVAGNCDKVYTIPVRGTIAEGFNPFELLNLINGTSLAFDKLTVDVNGKLALRGGVGKKLELKDIRISDYMKKDE